ncbi:MAG: helix-hairpin-helix domain-containing protein [Candidatus Paceibacterota bacterium]
MRVAGLFALAILFPAFAYAATVDINTANAALLDTLPGIGPSKAAAIIDYRTQHGPFVRIEDIQKVSGIGPSTYAEIKPFITVGDAGAPDTPSSPDPTPADDSPTVASTTLPVAVLSSDSGSPEYIPIPVLRIVTGGTRTISSGADVPFTAAVYDGRGNKRDDAVVRWSFGDGMQRTGANVFHAYYESGEYLAIVHAVTPDGGDAAKEIIVTVEDASIKIISVSSRGIALANNDSRTLDLSFWKLSMSGQEFKIPERTQILAGHTVLFPSRVIELPLADSALLLYPSGEVAATYPAVASVLQTSALQLPPSSLSYKRVQEVESITNTKANIEADEKQVHAPTAATELAAVGAALPDSSKVTPQTNKPATGIFTSPWTLGFIGTVVLAAGAFILL